MSNLQTRVVTALALAVLVLGTLASGSTPLWGAVMGAFCLGALWEGTRLFAWARSAAKPLVWAIALAVLGALAAFFFVVPRGAVPIERAYFLLIAAFWLVIAPRQLARVRIGTESIASWVMFVLLIGAAWLAALVLQRQGAVLLIAVVVIAVVADIAGYFVGRAFGRRKLAPAISPGKTIAGAIGGVFAAALWSMGAALWLGLQSGVAGALIAFVVGGALGACSVMGDLWESLLKRQAGVKDASQLLPGHGGVLDRIDAQLAVLPVATCLISWVTPLW
ncbi:MAG: phosphatidate cytidylyltransferase [Proteobacteria bacterium]|nr:phosphatidate cytidylyltransferase [Pseudomonadota bacterium]